MTRTYAIGLLSLTAFAVAAAAQTLTMSTKLIELGDVLDDAKVSNNITITNTGDQPLKIGRLQTTCGCTLGRIEKRELAPGESTLSTITFDPHGRSGPQHKAVTLNSNDPVHPQSTVKLTANVLRSWSLEPETLTFQLRGNGTYQEPVQVITVKNNAAEPLTLLSLDSYDASVRVDAFEPVVVDAGASREYRVRIDARFQPTRRQRSKVEAVARMKGHESVKKVTLTIKPAG